PADFRLPPTASGRGFDLLTSRTRRKGHSRALQPVVQARPKRTTRTLRTFLLSTFPQQFVQPVENLWGAFPQGDPRRCGPLTKPAAQRRERRGKVFASAAGAGENSGARGDERSVGDG